MTDLGWILAGGLVMSLIALSGAVSLLLPRRVLDRVLLPLVALAAGTLLGGAFFHMIPNGRGALGPVAAPGWIVAGFATFLALEQLLHWHHAHREDRGRREPFTYLILIGDGLHNFVGGLAVSSTFLISPQAGVMAWLAAAAHEIPQEIGDFGVLVHGGWSRRRALLWNGISALAFPVGGVVAWSLAQGAEIGWLVLFGAGNFIYIAASDLIPEIKSPGSRREGWVHLGAFVAGIVLMGGLALATSGGN